MIQNKWVKTILVILLVVTTILHTLYFEYPTHPDHYTLGQFTYALIQFGYAPWVLHWSSIFGYYPLSIASGFEFFMAVLNALTGLELPVIFYIFSSLSAVIAVLGVFLLMREFNAFETSYITALIFSTMVLLSKSFSFWYCSIGTQLSIRLNCDFCFKTKQKSLTQVRSLSSFFLEDSCYWMKTNLKR